MKTGPQFFVRAARKAEFPTMVSLCGKSVGASRRTSTPGDINDWSAEHCTKAGLEAIKVVGTEGSADARTQLKQGRVDAAAQGSETLPYIMSQEPNAFAPVGQTFKLGYNGIAVRKDDQALQTALSDALQQMIADGSYRVRVLGYLPGRPLHLAGQGAAQRRAVGTCLGRLDVGLASFRHAAEGHRLLWDIQHAAGLRGLLPHVPGEDDRLLASGILDRFEEHVVPIIPKLRKQVIHNDFNPHNVLLDERHDDVVRGIIDFGDMVRAPLVQDLATAAAYQLEEGGHPLGGPAEMVGAFHSVLPLLPEEVGILADLIATRLVATVLISGLRARRNPGNATYILRNYGRSVAGLRRIATVPRTEAQSFLLARLPT